MGSGIGATGSCPQPPLTDPREGQVLTALRTQGSAPGTIPAQSWVTWVLGGERHQISCIFAMPVGVQEVTEEDAVYPDHQSFPLAHPPPSSLVLGD